MPELPEAEVVVSQLRDRVLGAVLKDCWVGRPDIVRQGIETLDWYRGTNIITIQRRGKSVVLGFSRNHETRYFLAELGMTGLLLFRSPHASYQKHTHLILSLEGGLEPELRYWNPRRFGRIYLFDLTGLERFCHKRFGCDPLTVPWEQFRQLVMGRRGRLKALLMHQQVVAGIGNIYANEILYRARLHPYRMASRLKTQTIRRLYDAMQEVLLDAIRNGGSSVRDFLAPDGTEGRYQRRHLVYDRAGEPCLAKCGKRIRRLIGERSSFYCPTCQRRK
ncbi:MAG: bifunctional DNA-formamidopyrimidine glycosylase/DNA-(apurinic or apyrimidinic site) lyase [Nitrospirae bacterium]|nr:MAG: bifunctional DNA-formamidopyrimidine glycosylase/DNA-(apurinic or apyrimidinic site) lyase [Nitrospirota bacterium]